jgi:hypothetical protein
MIFCYTLEVCLVIWMQYKSICKNQYASVTLDLHSFPRSFAHIWYNWNPTFVVLLLNYDFNWNLSMKYNSSCSVFSRLLFFRMSTLKSPILMIRQCSGDYWIIVWKLFKNVKIEHEWTLYTHTICIAFHVLILKVVAIDFEPH